MSLNIVDALGIALLFSYPLWISFGLYLYVRIHKLRLASAIMMISATLATATFLYLVAPSPNRLPYINLEMRRLLADLAQLGFGFLLAIIPIIISAILIWLLRIRSTSGAVMVGFVAILAFSLPALIALYNLTGRISEIIVEDDIPIYTFIDTTISTPTAMELGPNNELYVAGFSGSIWVFLDNDLDGIIDQQHEFASGMLHPQGLAWGDDGLYVNAVGKLLFMRDTDGDYRADKGRVVFDEFPNIDEIHPNHQNHGLFYGSDGRLYVGSGSTTDNKPELHPYANAIFSINPDGSDMRTFATGLRNPYAFIPAPDGGFFSVDNGSSGCYYNFETRVEDCSIQIDVPEELNYVTEGQDYGAPRYFGIPDQDSGTIPPFVTFKEHTAPAGLVQYAGSNLPEKYLGQLFVSFWSANEIQRVRVFKIDDKHYAGEAHPFATGIITPTAIINSPYGGLFVASFSGNAVYHIGEIEQN